jgi:alkylation response protein AidB-like acyl-CoA dehydrogenase
MSADNWAKCPRCQRALDGTVQSLAQRLADAYGKVPIAEYTELQNKLAEASVHASRGHQTFREDYEIYGAETGVITVRYGGGCRECGLNIEFEDKHPIPGEEH